MLGTRSNDGYQPSSGTMCYSGFSGGSVVKNLPANARDKGDMGSVPGWGRSPGGGNGNPLQYSCLENLHGQKSLAGYSLRGRKELDTTEQPKQQQNNQYLLPELIFPNSLTFPKSPS